MKKNWLRKWIVILFIIICIFMGVYLGNSIPVAGAPTSITTDSFTMTVDYGYNRYAKFGRYLNVSAVITNKGEDFNGWYQVIAPKVKNNVAYRKEVSIAAGATDKVIINVPIMDDTGKLLVSLLDKKGKTLVEDELAITIDNYEKQVYIGILSDQRKNLDYLNTVQTRTFYLDKSNISDDYIGLDLLDIIVVSDYDINQLTTEQLAAIEQWVSKGGTLVIGTGEYADKTLANWNSFSVKNSGKTSEYATYFGMNEKRLEELKQSIISYDEERKVLSNMLKERLDAYAAETSSVDYNYEYNPSDWAEELIDNLRIQTINKNITDITLEGGYNSVMEGDRILMQSKPVDLGMVQLFSFDLGLEKGQSSFGSAVLFEILQNISDKRQSQLQEEAYGQYINYNINDSMSYTDIENIPKIGMYVIILALYLMLVGPILYIVLKKLDKRNHTWIVVPGLAVIFTVIVYVAGSGTRIHDPYIGYVDILNFQKEGDTAEENVFFSITAPFNHDFSVKTDGRYPISQLSDSNSSYYYYSYDTRKAVEPEEYRTAINYGRNRTDLQIINNPAFSPVYYKSESFHTMKNQFLSDIHYTGDGIQGSITNDFDFDITNSMLFIDGNVINMGEIPQGATLSVENKDSAILLPEDYMNRSTIINRVAGGTQKPEENTAKINRKLSVINYLLETSLYDNSNRCYFIGFKNDEEKGKQQDKLLTELTKDMDSFGTSVVMIPITVDYTKGNQEFVPSIQPYAQGTNNNNQKAYSSPVLIDGNITMEYLLPAEEHVEAIQYLTSRNKTEPGDYLRSFTGKIYFLNNATGKYDLIFQSREEKKLTNVENYVNKQNKITIRYETEQAYQGNPITIPEISYWKEAD